MLCVIDEFTREALAIRVKRRLNSTDVLETLADLMILRGPPDYVRSDNVLCGEGERSIRHDVSVREDALAG